MREARGRDLRTAGPDCYFVCPLRSRSVSSARKETRSKQKFHELKEEKSRHNEFNENVVQW